MWWRGRRGRRWTRMMQLSPGGRTPPIKVEKIQRLCVLRKKADYVTELGVAKYREKKCSAAALVSIRIWIWIWIRFRIPQCGMRIGIRLRISFSKFNLFYKFWNTPKSRYKLQTASYITVEPVDLCNYIIGKSFFSITRRKNVVKFNLCSSNLKHI